MPAEPPTPEAIRRTAEEVLQRSDYQLDSGAEISTLGDSLLSRALQWLLSWYISLAESLAFLPGSLRYPAAAMLVAVVAWLIYRAVRAFSRRVQAGAVDDPPSRGRSVRAADPAEYEALATAAHAEGRLVEGVRWLLRAALLRLEHAEKRKPRPGATNRELLRRYRATPMAAPLQTLVDTVDLHWYGDRPAEPADFEVCQASYLALRHALVERVASVAVQNPPGVVSGTGA